MTLSVQSSQYNALRALISTMPFDSVACRTGVTVKGPRCRGPLLNSTFAVTGGWLLGLGPTCIMTKLIQQLTGVMVLR